MNRLIAKIFVLPLIVLSGAAQAAVDSYHYLHVTIQTPWVIFLILAPMVLAPMVIMAILVWRHGEKRKGEGQEQEADQQPQGEQK